MTIPAIFWKDKPKDRNNFICYVPCEGYPVLPNDTSLGMNINECRSIKSLKTFIGRWETEYLEYVYKELNEAIQSKDVFNIKFWSGKIGMNTVLWSVDEYDKFGRGPDYDYILKDRTIYVIDYWTRNELSIEEYFINKLSEDKKNFSIKVCSKCVVRETCTRSLIGKTLCNDAYNEVANYVKKQLNSI
jgi:hypothetical protein